MKRTAIYGVFLFLAVWFFASRGMNWSLHTHPDELPVEKWIQDTRENGYISDRLYPSGWFELVQVKVKWEELLLDIGKRHRNWTVQDEKVDILSADSFRRRDKSSKKFVATIGTGREFNVFLTALSALAVFLACVTFGLHPLAAVFAGLVLGCNPFIMEHAHYCETDMGLVFSLVVSLWILGGLKRTGSVPLYVLFALANGFAVSCKYTLAPLLVPVLALPFLQRDASGKRPWRKIAWLLPLGFLVFWGGFVLGTPAIYKMPGYFTKVRESFDYGPAVPMDTAQKLAALFHDCYVKAGSLLTEMMKLGLGVIALFALSFAFCFKKDYRKRFLFAPAYLGVFLLFFLFRMPWIRNQECLPIVVILALAAALPVDWSIRRLLEAKFGKASWAPLAVAVFSMSMLFATVRDGFRMTSFFLLRETRAECQNWMAGALPSGTTMAVDAYLGCLERGTGAKFIAKGWLEQGYPESLTDMPTNPVRYYLRNVSHPGHSSNRHPFWKTLLPETQRRIDAFSRDCQLLMAWRTGPGRFHPAFTQPDIELWRLPAPGGNGEASASIVDIPVWFMRPSLIRSGETTLYVSEHKGPLGADEAIQTVGKRHEIRFQNPRRQWAVSRSVMGDHETKVVWDSFATPHSRTLPSGQAVAFDMPLNRLPGPFRSSAMPGTKIRLRGDDQTTLVLTSCVGDPAEAAFWLRTSGSPRSALDLLQEAGELSAAGKVEAFRAARALGVAPDAEWEASARMAVETFDEAINPSGQLPGETTTICGVPLGAVEDFARLTLTYEKFVLGRILPVFLPPGTYGVRVVLIGKDADLMEGNPLFNIPVASWEMTKVNPGRLRFTGTMKVEVGTRLAFTGMLPAGATDKHGDWRCRLIELTWNPKRLVAGEIEAIRGELDRQPPN